MYLIVFKQRSGTGTDSDATKGQIKIHDLLLHIRNNERNCSLKSSLITRTFFMYENNCNSFCILRCSRTHSYLKGTVSRDFYPQFLYINLIHQGHPGMWNIFKYGFGFAEIFETSSVNDNAELDSTVSRTLRKILHTRIPARNPDHVQK